MLTFLIMPMTLDMILDKEYSEGLIIDPKTLIKDVGGRGGKRGYKGEKEERKGEKKKGYGKRTLRVGTQKSKGEERGCGRAGERDMRNFTGRTDRG